MENYENNAVVPERSEEVDQSTEPKKTAIETLFHRLTIAHKLAIEEAFNDFSSSKQNVREEDALRNSVRDAFWNTFSEQINQYPPKLDLAFDVLIEIKKGLEDVMTPNVVSLRQEMKTVLDIDALREQAENGALDVMYYARFIIMIISKICAPVRDDEVALLKKETDIVALFRGILEILAKMNNDLAAYSLKAIKPNILANHLAYERDTFREYVVAIGGNLPLTTKWLLKHKTPSKNAREIIYDAYIDLLTWEDSEPYPETLIFDVERLLKLKNDYFRITMTCTITFLTLGLIPRELNSDDSFKAYLKKFLVILLSDTVNEEGVKPLIKNISVELVSKISESLKNKDPPVDIDAKMIEETIEQALIPENKVRTLVCTRIKEYLRMALTACPTSDQYFPPALVLFKSDIKSLRLYLESICRHNVLVSIEHYERILETAESN